VQGKTEKKGKASFFTLGKEGGAKEDKNNIRGKVLYKEKKGGGKLPPGEGKGGEETFTLLTEKEGKKRNTETGEGKEGVSEKGKKRA